MEVGLEQVNVLAELDRIGWAYVFEGTDELRVACPFHDDKTPSCSVSASKRVFKCYAAECGADGDILTFLAGALKSTRRVVWEDVAQRYHLDTARSIDPRLIEQWHSNVWGAGVLLKELRSRAVTDKIIERYRIGYDRGRITIPVHTETGVIVNVRRYLPGAPGPEKMRNVRGCGKPPRLYPRWPVDQLSFNTVVVCGGEMKALVAAEELNPKKIGAITQTGGEGNWEHSFSPLFHGKQVFVCLDIDAGGRAAAEKLCALLAPHAAWVGKILLPLDLDKYPHGDVNNFIAQGGKLFPLLAKTPQWEPATESDSWTGQVELTDARLIDAVKSKNVGRRLRVFATVSAMDTAPYAVPAEVAVTCDRNDALCPLCKVFAMRAPDRGSLRMQVSPEAPAILELVNTSTKGQRESIMRAIGVPVKCKSFEFRATTFQNVEDVRLSPQLSISTRGGERSLQPAYVVGHGLELNSEYELTCRPWPHPATQQVVLLASSAKPVADSLSSFEPTSEELDALRVFQPCEWTVEGLNELLDSLYDDLEANVTQIYMRRSLHVAADLAWHSLLVLPGGTKGWTEVLAIGDSAQGKSETVNRLRAHYGLGEKVDCKNASVAGLLGGLQQVGGRWFVTWGVIPAHDRRLVVLEELKGAAVEVIAKLTDMRSSGIAEIPKIEKRRTHARTRLLALSNPRSDRPMASYGFGVEAVKELAGSLEDVRRFDLIIVLAAGDVSATVLADIVRQPPVIEHRFTQELCRRLVLWAWTRDERQVIVSEAAQAAVLSESLKLCDEFSEAVPIVDTGSMRHKVLRLAAALATRTFSSPDPEMRCIEVRPCHVFWIANFLRSEYSRPSMGYAAFTNAVKKLDAVVDPEHVQRRLEELPFPGEFVSSMLGQVHIELSDVRDWCAYRDLTDAIDLVSFLRRKRCIARHGGAYHKTPAFIRLLKDMQERGMKDRPRHVEEF